MVEISSIRPASLSEIENAVTTWIKRLPKTFSHTVHFVSSKGERSRMRMSAPLNRDLRLGIAHQTLSCQFREKKLSLSLENFDVSTETGAQGIVIEFKRRQPLPPLKEALRSAENSEHPVFLSRALNALSSLQTDLSKQGIDEATSASTDYLVLVRALSSPTVAIQMADDDPLAAARLRGVERKKQLIQDAGGAFTSERVAQLLSITRQGVDKRRSQNQLIGLTQGRRGYAYPAFQFEEGSTLPGLAEILEKLGTSDPWMQLNFFVNPNDRLEGLVPADLLRKGDLASVCSAAEAYGEQGAA